ncbi:hypothetical protein BC831DRAFT_479987 [Entophlyctis helioformis]|nr:hypothetical protein BC831DRAFT_479987 [Entophlyctis helioformis]
MSLRSTPKTARRTVASTGAAKAASATAAAMMVMSGTPAQRRRQPETNATPSKGVRLEQLKSQQRRWMAEMSHDKQDGDGQSSPPSTASPSAAARSRLLPHSSISSAAPAAGPSTRSPVSPSRPSASVSQQPGIQDATNSTSLLMANWCQLPRLSTGRAATPPVSANPLYAGSASDHRGTAPSHDRGLQEPASTVSADMCPICRMRIQSPMLAIPCGHSFCQECIGARQQQQTQRQQTHDCPCCHTGVQCHVPNIALRQLLETSNGINRGDSEHGSKHSESNGYQQQQQRAGSPSGVTILRSCSDGTRRVLTAAVPGGASRGSSGGDSSSTIMGKTIDTAASVYPHAHSLMPDFDQDPENLAAIYKSQHDQLEARCALLTEEHGSIMASLGAAQSQLQETASTLASSTQQVSELEALVSHYKAKLVDLHATIKSSREASVRLEESVMQLTTREAAAKSTLDVLTRRRDKVRLVYEGIQRSVLESRAGCGHGVDELGSVP